MDNIDINCMNIFNNQYLIISFEYLGVLLYLPWIRRFRPARSLAMCLPVECGMEQCGVWGEIMLSIT